MDRHSLWVALHGTAHGEVDALALFGLPGAHAYRSLGADHRMWHKSLDIFELQRLHFFLHYLMNQ